MGSRVVHPNIPNLLGDVFKLKGSFGEEKMDGRKSLITFTHMKVIITGVTGMVGEGVMHECMISPLVDKILVIGRRSSGIQHPKVEEIILPVFDDPGIALEQVTGFDACFFCLGVSSVGMSRTDYEKMTHTLTLSFARSILPNNPGLCFCYISGAGTDSSEKGRLHWARVKGKTENEIFKIGFKSAYAFRPGYMHPTPGLKNTNKYYKYITWMYPIAKSLFPKQFMTLADMGRSMIGVAKDGYEKRVLEAPDILESGKDLSIYKK
jgi:hypothetical protein